MIALIEDNRDAIVDLCRQYGVKKLAVFGSAAKDTFDPETSDIDLVLDFEDYGPGVSHRFIYFGDALEQLFGRSVDFVFERKLSNPFFRQEVLSTMQVIYQDGRREPAVA